MTPKITGQRFSEIMESKRGANHSRRIIRFIPSEPSIIFSSCMPKRSETKGTASPQKDLESNSDSQKNAGK